MMWVAVGMPLVHPHFHHHHHESCGRTCPEATGASLSRNPALHSDADRHHGFCPICHFFSHFGKYLFTLGAALLISLAGMGAVPLAAGFGFPAEPLRLCLPRGPPLFSFS
jgi:hypothetical protein